jgi:outer membrane cobalamin receptor
MKGVVMNRYRGIAHAVVTLLFPLVVGGYVVFAGTTGKISGRVTDAASGEPVVGASVVVSDTKSGAATDVSGDYTILNIPPGIYTLHSSALGYAAARVAGVRVSIDFTTTIDIKLKESTIVGDEVVIVAERPLVRRDLTSSSATVGAEEIRLMPVESFQDILKLQAGVIVGSDGEIHERGGRASEVSYLIDGISVTDPYSGKASVEVGSEGIQELKFVSGTFNAEYGQVMSGVVDIVTKDGGSKLGGRISAYTGDYVSGHTETFMNIDHVDPMGTYSIQADLNGPIPLFPQQLRFLASVRYDYNEGWQYGKRVYNPEDSSNFENLDPERWYIEKTGDGSIVPMNDSKKVNLQGKITLSLDNGLKFSYNGLYTRSDYEDYDHLFKYDPNGNYKKKKYGYTNILSFTHVLSASSFYMVKLSNFRSSYASYLFEDPYDPRYVNPKLLNTKGAFSFHTGGTAMGHFYRSSDALVGKIDFTSQVNKENLVKAGVEIQGNKLWLHDYQVELDAQTGWRPAISDPSSTNNNEYTHRPLLAAAYVQDKIEVGDIVLNLGVRYDYFNSYGPVPVDLRDPDGSYTQNANWSRKATAKQQLSPRLGLAFPITDRGVIHFSYGHFFQIPPFEYLYVNPKFRIARSSLSGGFLSTLMGNADLNPQKTVIYEVGLQQQLFENVGLDLTAFYKDLRNLTATEVHELYTLGDMYARYTNLDYGNIRGITLSMQYRFMRGLSGTLDYTYSIAEGNASDPNAQFTNRQRVPPLEDEVQVLPLDWDQRHTVNFSINLGDPSDWTIGLVARLESGLPYTPEIQKIRVEFQNSGRRPSRNVVDLNMQKVLDLSGLQTIVYMKVYNLFDTRNENDVYLDTGRAGYSLVSKYAGDVRGVNTLAEFLNRPEYYSEPRKVLFGVTFEF